jgi:hypothetical protein
MQTQMQTQARASPIGTFVLTSFLISVAGFALGVLLRFSALDFNFAAILRFGIGAAVPGFVILIGSCIWLHRKTLIYAAEMLVGDLDRDGYQGRPPEPEPAPMRYLMTNAPVKPQRIALPDGDDEHALLPDDLRHLVHYVYTVRHWSGRRGRFGLTGMTLPSGNVLADYDLDVIPFLKLLERQGLLVGRGDGVRGVMVGEERGALLALRLAE